MVRTSIIAIAFTLLAYLVEAQETFSIGTDGSLGTFTIDQTYTNGEEGIYLQLDGNVNTGSVRGMYNDISPTGVALQNGVFNSFSGTGSGTITGFINAMTNSGNGNKIGLQNSFASTGSGLVIGMDNNFSAGSGTKYGISNVFPAITLNGNQAGVYNSFSSAGTGLRHGIYTTIGGTGSGQVYGEYTSITSTTTAEQHGNYVTMNNAGTNNKYGFRASINSASGGTHYGIWSSILKAGSYAGYFLGTVGIGTSAGDLYKLPASRGTNNQIMQSDASGNVSWVDPTTLGDNDWDRDAGNGYLYPTTLADDVGVGTVTPSSRLDVVDDGTSSVAEFSLTNALTSTGSFRNYIESNTVGPFTGILNQLILNQNATGEKTALQNTISFASANGPSGTKKGVHNYITSETGAVYGVENDFLITDKSSTEYLYGTYNEWAPNSGRTYGTYNLFDQNGSSPTGSRIYGSYSDINNVNAGAGASGAYRVYGEYNGITVNGCGFVFGNYNNIQGRSNAVPLSGGFVYGTQNVVNIDSMAFAYGVRNTVSGAGSNYMYGIYNNMGLYHATTAKYGVYNNIVGNNTESIYGIYNTVVGSSTTGDVYGSYNLVTSGTGTGYGVFSYATDDVNDYAGYFAGRVYVGDASFPGFGDGYILPIGDGTSGEVMQTDGAGQLSWTDPAASYLWTRNAGDLYPSTLTDNVGIGTGTPTDRLVVAGGRVEFTDNTDANGNIGSGVLEIANSLRIDGNEIVTNTNTLLGLQNGNNGDLQIDDGTFYVDASTDRVGIGITTPAYLLSLDNSNGDSRSLYIDHDYTGTTTNYAQYIDSDINTASSITNYGLNINVNKVANGTNTGATYGTYSVAYNRYTGSTSSNVYGVYGNGLKYTGTSGYAYGGFFTAYQSAAGTATYGIYATYSGSALAEYSAYFAGNTYCTGAYTGSDEKLKSGISPLSSSLEKILELPVRSYSYKTNEYGFMNLPEGVQAGFIAQEVEGLYPELVKTTVQPASDSEMVEKGLEAEHGEVSFKALNYTGLIPHLVRATQEQQVLIEENAKMKKENELLLQQMETISRRLAALEAKME